MLNNFLTAVISGSVVFLAMVYYYEIKKPVDQGIPDQPRDLRYEWFDFIRANINQCRTGYHCHQCRKLIVLFDQRFRKDMPPQIIVEWVEQLYNYLDNKYKSILSEDEGLSNLTSENVINIVV